MSRVVKRWWRSGADRVPQNRAIRWLSIICNILAAIVLVALLIDLIHGREGEAMRDYLLTLCLLGMNWALLRLDKAIRPPP